MLIDRQLECPVAFCSCCGGELYGWESAYKIPVVHYHGGYKIICEECFPDFAREFFADQRVILNTI